MQRGDKLTELLNRHFSGYEPQPPENDLKEFRRKLDRFHKLRKFLYHGIFNGMILFLLILNLPDLKELAAPAGTHPVMLTRQITEKSGIATKHFINQSVNRANEKYNKINNELKYDKSNTKDISKNESGLNNNNQRIPENPVKYETTLQNKNEADGNRSKMPDKISVKIDSTVKVAKKDTTLPKVKEIVSKKNDSMPITGNSKPNERNSKLLLRFTFSGFHSFNDFKVNPKNTPGVHEDYLIIRNKSEKNGWGFSLGANLEYWPLKRLGFTSGFVYDENRTQAKYDFINNKIPILDSLKGTILGYLPGNDSIGIHQTVNDRYSYLQIPLVAIYNAYEKNNISINLKLGGVFIYCLSANGKTIQTQELTITDLQSQTYSSFSLGILTGLCVRYRLNDRFSIGAEPFWNQYIGNIVRQSGVVEKKTNSAGLNAGLFIKLN